eukprot:TRINITY_DN13581_c0_g1_i2.p1 TRINITY_DN13581_c0_g1~~TRINITY_DN13581_c0_g1_i2.p1  ORF type:complete len:306 (-),score=58.72 TRINITY_DN13581_c0_g1_i2:99-1016(-)
MEAAVNDAVKHAASDPVAHMASFLRSTNKSLAEPSKLDMLEDDDEKEEEEDGEEEHAAQEYLEVHEPFRIIEECVNAALRRHAEDPEDPVLFMSEHLHMLSTVPTISSIGAAAIRIARQQHLEISVRISNCRQQQRALSIQEVDDFPKGCLSVLISEVGSSIAGMNPADQIAVDAAVSKTLNECVHRFPELSAQCRHSFALTLSLAVCRAGAASKGMPLYQHIADLSGVAAAMPTPVFPFPALLSDLFAGAAVSPRLVGSGPLVEAMRSCTEVFDSLKSHLNLDKVDVEMRQCSYGESYGKSCQL